MAADFNADQNPDLAVAGVLNSAVSILLNNGDGTFPQAAQFPVIGTTGITAMAVADLNHDGHPDLALANPPYVTILLGQGQGSFQPPVNHSTGTLVTALATGDFNGDSKLDLAVTGLGSPGCSFPPCPAISQKPPGVLIMLGNGDGTFQPAAPAMIGGHPDAIAVGDFNGDGKLDLVIGNGTPATYISILLGNGDGTFQAPLSYNTNGRSVAVAVADFNGDGKADIAVLNKAGSVAILIGKGDGTFQAPVLYGVPSPIGAPDALAIGDFNGDGKPDVAVTKYDPQAVAVLIGYGDGTFQPPVNYPASTGLVDWWAGGIAVADFNGDGFQDLAVVSGGGAAAVLSGKGDGTFRAPQYFGPATGAFLAVGEFARPGRPDIVSSVGTGISILIDTTP